MASGALIQVRRVSLMSRIVLRSEVAGNRVRYGRVKSKYDEISQQQK